MYNTHPFLQLTPARINTALHTIGNLIWRNRTPLVVEATESTAGSVPYAEAIKAKRKRVQPGENWGQLFDQRWCRVALPKNTTDLYLEWQEISEATLYVKGKTFYGFDVAHRQVKLPRGVGAEVWIETNAVQSAIWHPLAKGLDNRGAIFEGCWLKERDDEAWAAYHDLKVLADLLEDWRAREDPTYKPFSISSGPAHPVAGHTPAFRKLVRGIDEALDAFEVGGFTPMRKRMATLYSSLREENPHIDCILTGHAHIDLVWLWPERIGELKAVHTFSSMDRMMDEYPEFRFAYSQPASYEAVARLEPELFRRVKKRVASGQWEPTGGMYVESDTLLACGEALLRSFTVGQESFRELFGKPSTLTWLPDVFGYSACLPQMMRLTGVDHFFTTKMTWNAINRFPWSSFIWRGCDGSEVLAHVTQQTGYVTALRVGEVQAAQRGHLQSDVHEECLLPTGYGDGGGGPTEEMCERARRLNGLPGMPAIKWDQPEAFFQRLEACRDQLPVHQGECYLEFHRGTYTTHGHLKEAFRALERALLTAEAASAVTGKRWDVTHPWKRLIFAQFHDYIPGSSVWDVYAEGVPEMVELAREQEAKAAEALGAGRGDKACAFNPLPFPVRRWMASSPKAKATYVELPALGGAALAEAQVTEEPAPVVVDSKRVDNGLASFRVNAKGLVDRLSWEGTDVPLASPIGQLISFPDVPSRYPAWDIDRHTLSLGEPCNTPATVTPFEAGAHRRGFRVTRPVGEKSEIAISYYLEAGSPLLHIEVELDWQEELRLLKLMVPTQFAATHARFGIPYGSVLRPQVTQSMQAEAMWEVPFSRYLAVFDEGEREGLFLATECKYGASVRDGAIGLSLVRSALITGMDHPHSNVWPKGIARQVPGSDYSDQGKHVIRLALGRYDAGLSRERQPAAVAESLYQEPVSYKGAAIASPLESIEGDETLIPAWTKPLGKGAWLLRLQEATGRRGSVVIRAAKGWTVVEADANGESTRKAGGRLTLPYTPYQIKTVRFAKA